jgi:hypothetical protein
MQAAQLRHIMGTVDSAVRPEFQQNDLPSQTFNGERVIGIDPFQPFWKFGRVNIPFVAQSHSTLQVFLSKLSELL